MDHEIKFLGNKKKKYNGFFSVLNSLNENNNNNPILLTNNLIPEDLLNSLLKKEYCKFLSRIPENNTILFGPLKLNGDSTTITFDFNININFKKILNDNIHAFAIFHREGLIFQPLWPIKLTFSINEFSFESPDPRYKPESFPFWLDVTKSLKFDKNLLRINLFGNITYHTHYFSIIILKILTPNILLDQILIKTYYTFENWKELFKSTSSEDIEISEDWISIPLICPLGYNRIQNPVRGIDCLHLSCFDCKNYFNFQFSLGNWKCPICDKYCPPESLKIDLVIKTVLDQYNYDIEKLMINQLGHVKLL